MSEGDDDRSPLDCVPDEHDLCPAFGIAHHEAAHIAIAWAQGAAALHSADIVPDGGFLGAAVYSIGLGGKATIADVVSILAGPIAVRRLHRSADDLGSQDRLDVDRAMRAMCRSSEAAAIVLTHCRALAARLVAANWDAIEAVAEALERRNTLTGDELNMILDGVVIDRANASKPARAEAWARAQENAASFAAMTEKIV